MEVKPGYKQTEVGVIPEDWEVAPLAALCSKIQDGTHFSPKIRGGEFLYVTSKNIGFGALDVSDAPRIDAEQHANIYRRCNVKHGDLLLTKDGANTGNAALNHLDEQFSLLSSVAFLRFDPQLHDARYFLQQVLSHEGQRRMKDAMSGNAITRLTLEKINELRFSYPRLPEQRAIATALSDVDALLGGLDRLIAKKLDLKQAAMQQLLTGQIRLPGFHGEWEVKRLGEIGSTYGGLTGKTKSDFGIGTGRYVTFMNVMANVVIDCASFEQVRVTPSESQNHVSEGDLLFNGSSETPEEVAMCSFMASDVPNLFLNSFCFGFRRRDDQESDGLFLAYYLRANPGREFMKSLAQGSTRYNLSKVALLEAPIRLPLKAEQSAIAAVLSDIDAELAALEARRDKTRALKQGMMQVLLTGKKRLARPEAVRA